MMEVVILKWGTASLLHMLPSDSSLASCSLLQEARQQLSFDHRGKMEALEIDRVCLSLSVNSPSISFKVNPTRVPNG